MNLYDALGINKKATPEDIKRAYRGRARKTHPDAGGSADEFALVCRAKDILSDPVRREKYDRTGEEDAGGPDQAEAFAMDVAMQALGHVLREIEASGRRYVEFDLVRDAIRKIEGDIATMNENAGRLRAEATRQRDIAKRFKAKKGKPNRLRTLFENNAAQLERQAEAAVAPIKIGEGAIGLLRDHSFEVSVAPEPMVGVRIGGTNGFWRT